MEDKKEEFFGFTDEQIKRYSRQIVLPQVGGKGQRKLLNSKVLIVGAGALGSPTAQYLARAGVGSIGIIDDDEVHLSNLQRQLLYGTDDVGRKKVRATKDTLTHINPDIDIVTYQRRLDKENVFKILDEKWDMVVDGSDNFPTKFLLNDACVMQETPLSLGAILKFTGFVTTIIPKQEPCYRCLTPQSPPPGRVPTCQDAGVIGALPGIIGSIQAIEVIKFLLGKGELLKGKGIILDAFHMSFNEFSFRRNKNCPVCGKQPKINDVEDMNRIEYGDTCQIRF